MDRASWLSIRVVRYRGLTFAETRTEEGGGGMNALLTMDEAEAILESAEGVIDEWRRGELSIPCALACLQSVVEGEAE